MISISFSTKAKREAKWKPNKWRKTTKVSLNI